LERMHQSRSKIVKRLPKARFMNPSEYEIVFRVFGNTLPSRKRIIITNVIGFGNRAFTLPISMFGFPFGFLGLIFLPFWTVFGIFLLIIGLIITFFNLGYLINVGDLYENLENKGVGTLVHETAHVWQGENDVLSFGFVVNSCLNQLLRGLKAYRYEIGEAWQKLNVEQQASLIEDWFLEGESVKDRRWVYIKDYVRKGIT